MDHSRKFAAAARDVAATDRCAALRGVTEASRQS